MSDPQSDSCLFCQMVSGQIAPDVVTETETTLAFRDISPQAPVHVLVVPKVHHPDAVSLTEHEPQVMVDLVRTVATVVEQEDLGEGYRLVFNTGALAHQTVFHAHCHVLGGRRMGWPPG
jgi:histidine triad (HIT) family protein